ncbi:hypothetical protein J2S09_005058 [Bacillus fengqiuensis]|nr:hypothetical protein [Bacillus fengqiuensis]
MKFIQIIRTGFTVVAFVLMIAGCSEKDESVEDTTDLRMEGYVLNVGETRVLLAKGITFNKFQEIKDKSILEISKDEVGLIYLSYNGTNKLNKGDKVEAWISGGNIEESLPARATASKIDVIN